MNRKLKFLVVIPAAALVAIGLSACSPTPRAVTSSASCAFVRGDGHSGRDTRLHEVVYPGQNVKLQTSNDDATEVVSWVPCDLRDYIITNGATMNANKQIIGDRTTPSVGYTNDGVQIKVASTVNWTLNQSPDAMDAFYQLCFKFSCASNQDQGGNVNSSTPGWNNMLGETFGFVMNKLVLNGAATINDGIWQKHDPAQYKQLQSYMADNFATLMRPYTGYNGGNMFCGPGSDWKDPKNPGAKGNHFNCTAVTVSVDDVERGAVSSTDGTSGATSVNAQRLKTAEALYGKDAPQVLARLDEIAACKAAHTVCVFGSDVEPAVPAGN